jgi:hypothetical protein
MNKYLLSLFLMVSTMAASAQRGPGGVSIDANPQRNCRLWVDAGDLQLNDLEDVTVWKDKSISNVEDTLFWNFDLSALAPQFRNAPSAGINGKPVVSFAEGGMLAIGVWDGGDNSIGISTDLNSNGTMLTTYEQSIFLVFRTGSDVTNRQIIWEEGGSERGLATYIFNGEVYIGVYDRNANDIDPGPGQVPAFGFTYKKLPIQPNSTNTLSLVFKANPDNSVVTNSTKTAKFFGLKGTLNSLEFPSDFQKNCCGSDVARVGGIFRHPDPIGIGAQNRTTYHEGAAVNAANTGGFRFRGSIAEICYYANSLNDAERIIVENYLAAKYSAGVLANDRFTYRSGFGEDVIGIGQENDSTRHNTSQGDNLFEFSVGNMATAFAGNAPGYLLSGHNRGPLIWSNQNVPDSMNVQRLRRTWRWNKTGVTGSNQVTLKIDPTDLPALPTNLAKYGVLVESTSANFPNFNEANANITELRLVAGRYVANVNIPNGAFSTICAFRPVIQFRAESDFAIESDPTSPDTEEWVSKSAFIDLNYTPLPPDTVFVNVQFTDGAAIFGTDYTSLYPTLNPVKFAPGQSTKMIQFDIKHDLIENANAVRDFNIILLPSGTPPSTIGPRDTLNYSIFDNNPAPKATFQQASISVNESDGIIQIPVQILGSFSGNPTVTVRRIANPPLQYPAALGLDYTVSSNEQILTFNSSEKTQYYSATIVDDEIHEFDESFALRIIGATGGIGFDPDSSITIAEVVIANNDDPPSVGFITSQSEGYRGVGNPYIQVALNRQSAKETAIPFNITGGSAFNAAINQTPEDFSAPVSALVLVQAMDTVGLLYFDANSENVTIQILENPGMLVDRTIEFTLNEPQNANLGGITTHTYTIKPYAAFEFTGAAGVGQLRNNTFWLRPDLISGTGSIPGVPNISPTSVQAIEPSSGNSPTVPAGFTLNGNKILRFNGSNQYLKIGETGSLEGQHPLVNTSGFYDSKSMFIVIRPTAVSGSTVRCIYEQGGGDRGISLFIKDAKLHFNAWSRITTDGPFDAWGLAENGSIAQAVSTTVLVADSTYIVSWHYDRESTEGLKLYVNGVKEAVYIGNVGRLYTHTGRTGVGAVWHQTRAQGELIQDGGSTSLVSNYFTGDIAEVIYFNEPSLPGNIRLHEVRNTIIHNYLSAKFNIPLAGTAQVADLAFANAMGSDPPFNKEVAGVGISTGPDGPMVHGISKGTGQLKVSGPQFAASEAYLLWGHNGESFTNTWPFSYGNAALPGDILERSGRVWKFYAEPATGVDTVRIELSFEASANAAQFSADRSPLRLLTHTNADPNDFSNATIYNLGVPQPQTGTFVAFDNILITNGMYLALGNTSSAVPLPIELLGFDAKLRGDVVDLLWSTASEVNNDFFAIERASENLDWKTIATVPGAGNSNSRLNYSDMDPNPLKGLSYYRLRQVDFDGSSTLSEVVAINYLSVNDEDHTYLFPNPSANGRFYIRLPYAYADYATEVNVYSLSGKKVWQQNSTKGESLIEVNPGSLPAGMYIVDMRSELFSESKKLAVQ